MTDNSMTESLQSLQNRIEAISKINPAVEGRNKFVNSLILTCVSCDYLEGLKQLFDLLIDKDIKLCFQLEALAKAGNNNQFATFRFISTLLGKDYSSSQLNEVFADLFRNDRHEAIKLGMDLLCRNKDDENTLLELVAFFDNTEVLDYAINKGWDVYTDSNRLIKHAMIFSHFEILNYFNNIGYDLNKVYESPIVEIGTEMDNEPPHDPSGEVSKWIKMLNLKNKLSDNLPNKIEVKKSKL